MDHRRSLTQFESSKEAQADSRPGKTTDGSIPRQPMAEWLIPGGVPCLWTGNARLALALAGALSSEIYSLLRSRPLLIKFFLGLKPGPTSVIKSEGMLLKYNLKVCVMAQLGGSAERSPLACSERYSWEKNPGTASSGLTPRYGMASPSVTGPASSDLTHACGRAGWDETVSRPASMGST